MAENSSEPLSLILKKYQIRPKKALGQNFLTDPSILEEIAAACGATKNDTILEIGAGLGHLTQQLAKKAKLVLAVELDQNLVTALEDRLKNIPNIQIIPGDILQIDPAELILDDEYLVAANIPYYITSAIIRHLLESNRKPRRLLLTIQYEVAMRICSEAGNLSVLALSVQVYGKPTLIARIPAGAFYPVPKVDSALLRIDLYSEPSLSPHQRDLFFELIKAGFQHKRKTLRNSLSKGLQWPAESITDLLNAADIDPQRRAQTLTLPEWLELTQRYDKIKSA